MLAQKLSWQAARLNDRSPFAFIDGLLRFSVVFLYSLRPAIGGTAKTWAGIESDSRALKGLVKLGDAREGFGLRSDGAHAGDDEYVFIGSIAPRLYLSSRIEMNFSRGLVQG